MLKRAIKKSKKKSPKKNTGNDVKAKLDDALQIIQTSKYQTVSNRSTLTYNIGVDDEKQVYVRIIGNTGGGQFSNEWISFSRVTLALGKIPSDKPISSLHLASSITGKSVNTPGYLLAVLLNEKLLSLFEGKKRQYVFSGADAFLTKLNKGKASKKRK